MRKSSILTNATFNPERIHERLVHESDSVQVKSLHLKAGQELPVQSFDDFGESMLVVLGGEGKLLGKHGVLDTLVRGDVVITDLRVPHGLRATKDMSVLASLTQLVKPED
ncbi:MAG: cupin [Desulfovibrionales bacterium]|nr:cupin [Desulfovibrionales bacterium]